MQRNPAANEYQIKNLATLVSNILLALEPTGFPVRDWSDCDLAIDTDTFSITPTDLDAGFDVLSAGRLKNFKTAQTYDLSTISGIANGDTIFVYFNSDFVLHASRSSADWDFTNASIFVSMIYVRNYAAHTYVLENERHGIRQDAETHYQKHTEEGAKWDFGFGEATPTTSISLDLDAGEYHDEDIHHNIGAQDAFDVWYADNASPAVWQADTPDVSFYTVDGSGKIEYFPAGVRSAVSNNYYVNFFIFATNIQPLQSISIPSTNQYANNAAGRLALSDEKVDVLNLTESFAAEFKPLYRIALQNSGTIAFYEIEDLRKTSQIGGSVAVGYTDGQAVEANIAALGVYYSDTPVANDFAKFNALNTVEGRSYAETKADLSLEDADINTLAVAALKSTNYIAFDMERDTSSYDFTSTTTGTRDCSGITNFPTDAVKVRGVAVFQNSNANSLYLWKQNGATNWQSTGGGYRTTSAGTAYVCYFEALLDVNQLFHITCPAGTDVSSLMVTGGWSHT